MIKVDIAMIPREIDELLDFIESVSFDILNYYIGNPCRIHFYLWITHWLFSCYLSLTCKSSFGHCIRQTQPYKYLLFSFKILKTLKATSATHIPGSNGISFRLPTLIMTA